MYVSNRVQPWPSKYPRSVSGSRVAKRLAAPMVTCDLKQILMAVKAILIVAHFSRFRGVRKPSLTGEIASCQSRMLSVRRASPNTDSGPARHLIRDVLIHVKRRHPDTFRNPDIGPA